VLLSIFAFIAVVYSLYWVQEDNVFNYAITITFQLFKVKVVFNIGTALFHLIVVSLIPIGGAALATVVASIVNVPFANLRVARAEINIETANLAFSDYDITSACNLSLAPVQLDLAVLVTLFVVYVKT
jgi:hypothetical protein